MSFSERLNDIRTGFERPFWVANITEIFERLSYYGASAVLAIYLTEQLHFSKELTGWMIGTFGFVVWFLPVLGGTLADRFGVTSMARLYPAFGAPKLAVGKYPPDKQFTNPPSAAFAVNGYIKYVSFVQKQHGADVPDYHAILIHGNQGKRMG